MATIAVLRQGLGTPSGRDRHGDPVGQTTNHFEPGAKVAWGSPTQDNDDKRVTTTNPVVYFHHRVPDIVREDILIVPGGRRLRVVDVQHWEHARYEYTAGVAVICTEVS